ncbi:MAG: ATP-grasp domain-containing protein [Gammaproteobacteria bacterium]|nr:ATP-grasp domain-containing protein [Gammaproteobacteria bacterium]
MQILVVEYLTAGGLIESSLPPSLLAEATMMLQAIVTDLVDCQQADIQILLDERLSFPELQHFREHVQVVPITHQHGFRTIWLDAIQYVDAVFIIAPESGGLLQTLCRDVERANTLLLNSSSVAVEMTASKIKTSQLLAEQSIAVIKTDLIDSIVDYSFPIVIKPDDGVGSEGIHILPDKASIERFKQTEQCTGLVKQPFLEGQAASLSVVFNGHQSRILSYNQQLIEPDQDLIRFCGTIVGEQTRFWHFYKSLVMQIAAIIPGLKGYVGIDVVETESGPVLLEINPRLTTSYAGLRQALSMNPAECILQCFTGQGVSGVSAKPEYHTPVRITIDHCHAH